jgi:hypothetical protein
VIAEQPDARLLDHRKMLVPVVVDDIDRDPGHLSGHGPGGGQRPAEVGERLPGLNREVAGADEVPSASSGSWPATNTNRLPVATTTWV